MRTTMGWATTNSWSRLFRHLQTRDNSAMGPMFSVPTSLWPYLCLWEFGIAAFCDTNWNPEVLQSWSSNIFGTDLDVSFLKIKIPKGDSHHGPNTKASPPATWQAMALHMGAATEARAGVWGPEKRGAGKGSRG